MIIPCRNEAADIAGCLDAIAAQDLATEEFDVLLVDGESTDSTVEVALAAADAAGLQVSVLSNPDRTAATALNLGLRSTEADIVVRVDARSRIGPTHLRRCRDILADPRIGVAGGGQRPVARPDPALEERGIVRALSNRYTTGLARYRRSDVPGPADTVWMGAFRRQDLVVVEGWPLQPAQNQDYRLNQALRRRGLQVWFDPALTADYLPRRTIRQLARQYWAFGRAKGSVWRDGAALSPRHVVILAVPPAAALALGWAARRYGPERAGLAAVGCLVFADHMGGPGPASLPDRLAAVVAMVVADGSWFVGAASALVRR